ncbi:MAG: caspase family protein [Candidatus Cloacimonetes bacterium]|nr:caspase family protein [Candidatus Cloacimonadota bacterium]
MKKLLIISIMIGLCIAAFADRKALVIANYSYDKVTLSSPKADADSMALALKKLNFKVKRLDNCKLAVINAYVDSLAQKILPEDEIIFYYSGHGVSTPTTNYLVPAFTNLGAEQDLSKTAYSVSTLAQKLRTAKTSIIILEASRNWQPTGAKAIAKPFISQSSVSGKQVIISSASPNAVVQNSALSRSVFTDAFIRLSRNSEDNFNVLFPKVVAEVKSKTANNQVPWISGTLSSEFKFVTGEVKLYWRNMRLRGIEGGGSISW